jgi:hypothetical protein
MNKICLALITCLISNLFNGQQSYFQQKVNTKINVELDDENHILRGNEEIVYKNNSNEKLDSIIIHLWPNAYRNSKSELAKQKNF